MNVLQRKTISWILSVAMIVSVLMGIGIIGTSAEEDNGAVLSGGTVIPSGVTTYDFSKLTTKTLAAGTEGFEGFSGTVSTAASSSKAYVQITKTTTDALQFVVEGTWSATFTSTHSNNAKGLLITAPDGKKYGKKATDEGLSLSDMAPGTYTISAVTAETVADDGNGQTVTLTANHAYIGLAQFTVESSEPPADVTGLVAKAGNNNVALSWDASQGATEYEVTVSGSDEVTTVDRTSYTATGLDNGTEYTFSVTAVNSSGKSVPATVSATPTEPTDPPSAFILNAEPSDKAAVLVWGDSEYASTYDVYQDNSLILSDLTVNTTTVTGLTNGTSYSFKVVAKNKNGSMDSNAESVTPKEADPSNITIVKQDGELETAYAEWTNVANVDRYNVYVKEIGGTYEKIDDELVRFYDSYYRADALGLKAGVYKLKIAAVVGGVETDSVETGELNVLAHTREGFAFDPTSTYYSKDGIGGYKYDGTLRDNAQIIYIDDKNKDTVTHTVMVSGKPNEGVGLVNILELREKNGAETTPLIIRMIGKVESPSGKNSAGYVQLKGCQNVTLEGVGRDATTYHWSLLLRDTKNVEVRNIAVMEFYDDGISLDTANFNDWIHNVDIFYGQDRGGDQKKGDGSLDVKSGSDYCTFSYNHFWDSGKSSLCGMKVDSYMGYHMTYHHNWFDHSDSRHPRVRGDQVHIYNNYFDGNSKYGSGSCTGSSLFVEKNVYRNVKYAVLTSMQGSDILDGDGSGTFSGEDGGVIKMFDNKMIAGAQSHDVRDAKDSANGQDFDAYVATERNEQIPSTFTAKKGGSTYTNFDTAATMYTYTPDSTEDVVQKVEKYAGRVEGGDFYHEFNDEVDDPLYDRDPVLGTQLQQYKTTLVKSYTTAGTYPGTGGALPTAKPIPTEAPTLDPSQPTPTATVEPTAKPTAKPSYQYWKASANINPGDVLSPLSGLTTVEAMTYTAKTQAIDGQSFTGKCVGTTGAAADGKSGAALQFTPETDGTFIVYYKINASKIFYIMDADGTVVASYENKNPVDATGKGTSEYKSTEGKVQAGKTYYAFVEGSKAEFWGAGFAGTVVEPTEVPTSTPKPTTDPASFDYVITKAEFGTDGKLGVELQYSGTSATTAKLVVAAYAENGVMLEAKMFDVNGTDIENLDYTKSSDTSKVKVYLLDNTNSVKPMSTAVEATQIAQ